MRKRLMGVCLSAIGDAGIEILYIYINSKIQVRGIRQKE